MGNLQYLRYFSRILTKNENSTKVWKFENDQFIITHVFEENGPNEATMYGELIPLKVVFRFERDIKSFDSEIDFVKQINKRELEIDTDLNTISYGKGTKKVVVSF